VRFEAMVEVSLRPGIADPQGATIEKAVHALGFSSISGVRAGKSFRFEIDAPDEESARASAVELCRRLLTNPVIEDSEVTLNPSRNPSP
jgi:phosphoribosylformylglycinamidine synthase